MPDYDPVLCLPTPQPPDASEPAPEPPTTEPPSPEPAEPPEPESQCGITDIPACVNEAIDGFFRSVVTGALNPLLDLLSRTLLTTPTPESMPRVAELWESSWQILLASYAVLVAAAGVLVMAYESLQTRHSIKEIAPRLAVGFLAGALSLVLAGMAIDVANALAGALMGGGVDGEETARALEEMIMESLVGGFVIILLGLVLAGLLLALLVTYVVRVALTIVLVVGAPIALMFHALPQTEGIAKWWWRAFGGCLAIQVVQSLTLITAIRVFLTPGGFTQFGPQTDGLVNLIVAIALLYILFKIPFWVLSSIRGGGRSLIGSAFKGWLAYKTFGLLGGGRNGSGKPSGGDRGNAVAAAGAASSPDPYARSRITADGQYTLPLPGVRTRRPVTTSPPSPPTAGQGKAEGPPGRRGRQLTLPLGQDWPENRLPLDVTRASPPSDDTPSAEPSPRPSRSSRGRQLELPLDPYKGNRPDRSGQYRLPLEGVRKVTRPDRPKEAPPPRSPRQPRVRQPPLPFDPYQGNRPDRSGQYRLPLDGVQRVPPSSRPEPPPGPSAGPAAPSSPQPPVSSSSRPRSTGGQQRLPLDLPRPPRSLRTPPPESSPERKGDSP
ncbi:hypothetical protein [Actinoalloteichus caeruleus]|uniref:hypothetical protein n=1 Tax=Actinoalloteichus cyanogriseus TaxID=2893586 RepID=UPI003AAF76F9